MHIRGIGNYSFRLAKQSEKVSPTASEAASPMRVFVVTPSIHCGRIVFKQQTWKLPSKPSISSIV